MASVEIELPHHRYRVVIEPGGLSELGRLLHEVAPNAHCALLADARVDALYGDAAEASLRRAGYSVCRDRLEPGEAHKTLVAVERIWNRLLDARLERRSPLVALGGGVTSDIVGFAAASYLRGVPFVPCPTTLLAMVDASVGGKTGVDVPQGKNLIGAFHQPVAVLIDPLTLRTLPERELRCGLAECIKHAVIRDEALFEWIADSLARIRDGEPATLVELVRRNVEIKAAVVVADECERGERAHLNFGHTFAHAIETTLGYGVVEHGEAVGLGMLAATRMAVEHGLCSPDLLERLARLLEAVGLPRRIALPTDEVLREAMRLDKKVAGSRLHFVLPDRMGHVVVRDDLPPACLEAGWHEVREAS